MQEIGLPEVLAQLQNRLGHQLATFAFLPVGR